MVTSTSRRLCTALTVFVLSLSGPAGAQQGPPVVEEQGDVLAMAATGKSTAWSLKFTGGYSHLFSSDISGGGSLQENRYGGSVELRIQIDLDTDVTIAGAGQDIDYQFNGFTGLGGKDPWGDIGFITAGAIFRHRPSNDWELWGGPYMNWAWENGTDFNDSFIAGGIAGFSYKFGEDLRIGIGFGANTRLEETARWYPVFDLYWKIAEDWTLVTRGLGIQQQGLELIYKLPDDWELAAGVGYEYLQFRLDDDGIASDGVGQDTSIPLWLRLGKKVGKNFRFDLFASLVTAGELKLIDADGRGINSADYDATPVLGAHLSLRF